MSEYNSKCPLNCNKKGCGTNLCQRYADYQQGRADERERILKMVDWKAEQDIVKRQIDIHIDFAEMLTEENVLSIIAEQLRLAMQKGTK